VAGRIVLFGATGYTGRLVADALVERGAEPVLAARSADKLEQMAADLGGLETRTADVAEPETVRALVKRGDVLVTTVGPFLRWGEPAIHAAIDGRASAYIDSTGESPFIHRVFTEFGPQAKRARCALITASGYDYVPGNLAGALALRKAGEDAHSVEIGYFVSGSGLRDSVSGGTAASALGFAMEQTHGFRDGRIVTERMARSVARFDVNGSSRQGVSLGASEHLSLPRVYPQLRQVVVYLGWLGPASRAVQGLTFFGSQAAKLPGARPAMRGVLRSMARGSSGGPDADARAKSRSHVVARACDGGGRVLAEAHLEGVNGYTFTAQFMAWAAIRAAEGGVQGAGALGPVEAFGLDELQEGCADCGLDARVTLRTAD
jgi:short subunit dehydrogenase-like uncharacterized protein